MRRVQLWAEASDRVVLPCAHSRWLGLPHEELRLSLRGQVRTSLQLTAGSSLREIQAWGFLGVYSRNFLIISQLFVLLQDQVAPQKYFAHPFSKIHFLTILFLFYFFPSRLPHSEPLFLARTIAITSLGLSISTLVPSRLFLPP